MFDDLKCKAIVERFNKKLGLTMVVKFATEPEEVLLEDEEDPLRGRTFIVSETSEEERAAGEKDYITTEVGYDDNGEPVRHIEGFGYCKDFAEATYMVASALMEDRITEVWASIEVEALGIVVPRSPSV